MRITLSRYYGNKNNHSAERILIDLRVKKDICSQVLSSIQQPSRYHAAYKLNYDAIYAGFFKSWFDKRSSEDFSYRDGGTYYIIFDEEKCATKASDVYKLLLSGFAIIHLAEGEALTNFNNFGLENVIL